MSGSAGVGLIGQGGGSWGTHPPSGCASAGVGNFALVCKGQSPDRDPLQVAAVPGPWGLQALPGGIAVYPHPSEGYQLVNLCHPLPLRADNVV